MTSQTHVGKVAKTSFTKFRLWPEGSISIAKTGL